MTRMAQLRLFEEFEEPAKLDLPTKLDLDLDEAYRESDRAYLETLEAFMRQGKSPRPCAQHSYDFVNCRWHGLDEDEWCEACKRNFELKTSLDKARIRRNEAWKLLLEHEGGNHDEC